jgi:hypothetical protein
MYCATAGKKIQLKAIRAQFSGGHPRWWILYNFCIFVIIDTSLVVHFEKTIYVAWACRLKVNRGLRLSLDSYSKRRIKGEQQKNLDNILFDNYNIDADGLQH